MPFPSDSAAVGLALAKEYSIRDASSGHAGPSILPITIFTAAICIFMVNADDADDAWSAQKFWELMGNRSGLPYSLSQQVLKRWYGRRLKALQVTVQGTWMKPFILFSIFDKDVCHIGK